MLLIEGDRVVALQIYDDERDEYISKVMSIIDLINTYTDEGVTEGFLLSKKELK